MKEFLFQFIGDIDADQVKILSISQSCNSLVFAHISYFVIVHFQDLLLERALCLSFAVVKRRVDLLSAGLNLLARTVIFALRFLQIPIRCIALLLQFNVEIGMAFPNVLILRCSHLQRFSDLGN